MRALLLLLAALLLLPAAAQAQLEEEAARQIALARDDLEAGNFERAVNSASSALRLNPLLYEGLVIKGLAYEQLNEPMLAYSLLVTYQELSRGLEQNPDVAPALARLRKLIGGVTAEPPPAAAPAPVPAAPEVDEVPVTRFEILSRRNQVDLFDERNKSLPVGPAYARFRSQSRSKGDDFTFGLATVRWEGRDADIDDPVFTLILDSEKLVSKARDGGSLPFELPQSEHDVHVWYDGEQVAYRVDGEAFGPFEARKETGQSAWFLHLEDDARAWDLEARPWDGSLASGEIPHPANSAEVVEVAWERFSLEESLTERTKRLRLPDMSEAEAVRFSMQVTCMSEGEVLLRVPDGREVLVRSKDTRVRGAAKMRKMRESLRCAGSPEELIVEFAADGSVRASIRGEPIPITYPGRRRGERPEIHVEGDTLRAEDVVIELGKRKQGKRRFQAGPG